MQELTFTLHGQLLSARFDVDSSDIRGDMTIEPDEYRDWVAWLVDGEQDGRGCVMSVGAFTPSGVAMALEGLGIAVSGVEEATSADLDGGTGEEIDSDMLESAPAHVRRHQMMLGILNEK